MEKEKEGKGWRNLGGSCAFSTSNLYPKKSSAIMSFKPFKRSSFFNLDFFSYHFKFHCN